MSDQRERELDWQTGRELEQKDAEIASLRAQLASARKALEHAQVRFRCVADDAEERGDTAAWAMASVDADRMATALMTRKGKS